MESLIPVISKLQDVFATVGSRENEVQLPQIVVVGSQSAGKSSVIEGIVGRDFLPRGNEIVTRRPLLIHLIPTSKDAEQKINDDDLCETDWATFGHQPDKIYTDFEKVREEIQTETNRLTGTDRNISDVPIILKIYSKKVVNLSLIDLPGITKVPVGEQPADIEEIVREMILSYIENPQTIILAVTPANQDLANSEALKLAREVDPHGDRTLCVLTKLDLMDRGTNAMKVLRGETIPVKLGIIGVVNRSQEDINLNQSIEDCLKNEKSFLHDNYRPLALKNGTKYLAKTLNKLLIDHIRESLPDLKERVSKMTIDFQKNLDEIGEAVVDHKKTFFQVLSRYSSAYITTLDGSSTDVESSDLIGGARICSIFYEEFEKDINSIDSMGDLTVEEVLSAIKNSSGLKPPILIPERSFDTLVKKQMQRFKVPMLRCVKLVYDELVRIIQHCSVEVQRFPLLYDRIRKVISTFLSTRFIKTKKFVGRLLDIEIAFINTKHPEFTVSKDLVKVLNKDPNASEPIEYEIDVSSSKLLQYYSGRSLSNDEKRDFCITERLIDQYFIIVQKSIKDKVPKAIMNFLVNHIMVNLQSELNTGLYNEANADELLVESGNMTQRRKETAEMLEALNKANDLLIEVRDTEPW